MTQKTFAKVVNQVRGYVDVEVIEASIKDDYAIVRAVEGAPFQTIPSSKGGPVLMSDQAMVRIRELIAPYSEDAPDYGDPAAEDAEAERRQTQEWLDEQERRERNYYGEA
ncbi:MAG: hypothetical protein ACYC36_15245 [Bellilinea sp.]